MFRLLVFSMTVCLVLTMPATGLAQSGKDGKKGYKVKVLNSSRVYYPKPARSKTYKKVGLVSCATALNATPEYKEITRRGIRPGTAEYDLLLKRASDRFKKAIRTTVSLGGYDLIAETGAVTVEGKSLPDITATITRHITGK